MQTQVAPGSARAVGARSFLLPGRPNDRVWNGDAIGWVRHRIHRWDRALPSQGRADGNKPAILRCESPASTGAKRRGWRLVHRHADPRVDRQAPESV